MILDYFDGLVNRWNDYNRRQKQLSRKYHYTSWWEKVPPALRLLLKLLAITALVLLVFLLLGMLLSDA